MTVDRLPEALREGPHRDREQDGLAAATILSMCDHLLGEVGRRSHMFTWLRPPGASAGEWLAVDAYYPRSRLVVMCEPIPGRHEALYRELVPARGLGLLTLDPAALGHDRAAVQSALAAKIFDLEQVPPRKPAPQPAGASQRGPQHESVSDPGRSWTPVKVERAPVAPAVEQGLGVVIGLVLAAVLIAELYLAAVVVALGAGRPILGFAIALEACSRGLGTAAAERAGQRGWACACAVGGAPVVAWFALALRAGRAEAEPAPLAGLLALLAGVLALVALLIAS
jgi:hypothetical protein